MKGIIKFFNWSNLVLMLAIACMTFSLYKESSVMTAFAWFTIVLAAYLIFSWAGVARSSIRILGFLESGEYSLKELVKIALLNLTHRLFLFMAIILVMFVAGIINPFAPCLTFLCSLMMISEILIFLWIMYEGLVEVSEKSDNAAEEIAEELVEPTNLTN